MTTGRSSAEWFFLQLTSLEKIRVLRGAMRCEKASVRATTNAHPFTVNHRIMLNDMFCAGHDVLYIYRSNASQQRLQGRLSEPSRSSVIRKDYRIFTRQKCKSRRKHGSRTRVRSTMRNGNERNLLVGCGIFGKQ